MLGGMKELSIGKIRGLQQIANRDGILSICAMDHRGSLRRMINPQNPGEVDYAEMVKRKLELCSSLAGYASAVLLDPIFGAAQGIKYDLPFLVEPVSYPIGSEANNPLEFAANKGEIVIGTAREITALPIDVLKAEFPADLLYQKDKTELVELCRQLDNASPVPWVILSAGVDFELFYQQVEIACQAGASGFLGGRAIWQEAMYLDDERERLRYLSTVGVDRLKRLTEIASKYAVPWYQKFGLAARELADVAERWFQEY